jgi:mono/diheme cytochrome c family protein
MTKFSVWSFAGGFVACLLVVLLVGYCVIAGGAINPGADEPIPEWERWMAKTSLRAYLKANTPAETNPFQPSEKNFADAIDIYFANCAVCHGDARGERTTVSSGLYKKPNIFAGEDWSDDKDGLVYWFIEHGVRLTGMPAYNKTLSKDEKWKLVLLIKNVMKLPPASQKYWESKRLAETVLPKRG